MRHQHKTRRTVHLMLSEDAPWEDRDKAVAATNRGDYYEEWWGTSTRRNIDIGDRVILIETGSTGGIVAGGLVVSECYDREHFSEPGKIVPTVNVEFSAVYSSSVVSQEEIQNCVGRLPQSGGKDFSKQPESLAALDRLWHANASREGWPTPERKFREGSQRRGLCNRYERNPAARDECLKILGYKCVCCDTLLSTIYGEIADQVIHVHHVTPISERGECIVNPVRDLVPVCPNCHAIIHLKSPPLAIKEVRLILREGHPATPHRDHPSHFATHE